MYVYVRKGFQWGLAGVGIGRKGLSVKGEGRKRGIGGLVRTAFGDTTGNRTGLGWMYQLLGYHCSMERVYALGARVSFTYVFRSCQTRGSAAGHDLASSFCQNLALGHHALPNSHYHHSRPRTPVVLPSVTHGQHAVDKRQHCQPLIHTTIGAGKFGIPSALPLTNQQPLG